jgi:signal transduction histidine kinase
MLHHLINWLNEVTFLGIKGEDTYLTKFRKRILNRTFFVLGFTALVFMLEGIFFKERIVILISLFFIFFATGLLYLNHRNRFQISFYVLSFLFPSIFLGIIILYGDALRVDYTLSFFIVLVLALYNNKWIRTLNVVFLIILQIAGIYYTSHFPSPLAEYVNPADRIIVFTSTTFCLFILVYQFIRESNKYQNRQQELNEDLDKKNRQLQDIIVEKERLNLELVEKSNELQRANDFLESYTYITSHDLKTPVRTINSFSDLLKKKLRHVDDPDIKEYLDFIKSGALQMDSILNGIIENAQSNRSSLKVDQVDCNALLEEIMDQFKFRLEEINGEIAYTTLPAIRGDKMMLKKVFFNLIDNGLKYNDDPKPRVFICYQQKGNWHEFTVADNGMGIQTRYSQDIFKMFKKLHTANQFAGSGVGLALCRKIIELHSGRIWLAPSKEKGSTFQFQLPLALPATE